MRTRRLTRSMVLATVSASALSAPLCAQTAATKRMVAGWIVVMKTTIDSGTGRPPTVRSLRTVGSGSRLRLESSSRTGGAPGVTISDSITHERLMVDLDRKTVLVGELPKTGMMLKFEPISLDRQVKDLGRSALIAGLETRHYEVAATIGSRVSLGARSCVIRRRATSEYWMTTDAHVTDAMKQLHDLMMVTVGADAAVRQLPRADPPGIAVRSVAKHADLGADGKHREITITSELVEFHSGPVDASLFEAPVGYERRPMATPRFSATLDSLNRAASARAFSRLADSALQIVGETRTCTTVKGSPR